MDQRKRTILVIAIAITIIAGVLSGFGLPFFLNNPEINLPTLDETTDTGNHGGTIGDNEDYTLVSISSDTVQDVIATLKRKEQYYREVKVERWGNEENRKSSIYTSLIWNDGEYSKVAVMDSRGSLQNCIIANGKVYLWYGSDKTWYESAATDEDIDLIQNIPTYEDVLALDRQSIVRAGYVTKLGSNCIFVEAKQEELGYLERFWVSVDTGLLVASETVKAESGILVYSMTEKLLSHLNSEEGTFALPDGTVLHRVVVVPEAEE